jgi:hypothetical protein
VAQGHPPGRPAGLPPRGRHGRPDEPAQSGRSGRDGRARPERWEQLDAFDDRLDEDLPPWAGLGIHPTGPGGKQIRPPRDPDRARARVASPDQGRPDGGDWPDGDDDRRRGGEDQPRGDEEWPRDGDDWPRDEDWPRDDRANARRGRQAAARARKSRRRLLTVAGAVVAVAAITAAALWVTKTWPFQSKQAVVVGTPLVTTFQPGEFRSVPNACDEISPALLAQYLPGKVAQVSQALGSNTQSQCTWTLDHRPSFRVLAVSTQAYAPSLLASGDGSATASATDAYAQALQGLRDPLKSSRQPPAQLGATVGLGRYAFTALQVFHFGDTTDKVTVVVRDRNVLIDVTMQAQEHGGGFRPVPVATLRAAALAAAHEVLAGLR